MIQIPKSRILENQYTNGTGIGKNLALRFVRSKIPYIGYYVVINGPANDPTSITVTLNVNTAPAIDTNPTNKTV
jgi:hypothetical protein